MAFWSKKENEQQQGIVSAATPVQVEEPMVLKGGVDEDKQPSNDLVVGVEQGDPEKIIADRFGSKLRAALGSGTIIQGKLSFDTPIRIDGKLKGEIFSSRALIVGPTANVEATIDVQSLIVFGAVKGEISAVERVELFPGAVLEGDIRSASLVIHEGARFEGASKMASEANKAGSIEIGAALSQPNGGKSGSGAKSGGAKSSSDYASAAAPAV